MVRRWIRRARRLPLEALASAIVLFVSIYVIAGPLLAARYPLMTDLPQHAANASVLRHYFDADWHFQEQLTIRPFAVPYMLFYVLAAGLMFLFPKLVAVKMAVFMMLALLPAGLATLFWGMRKSPLLGIIGLLFCWGSLASWGFLNFVGALGLWAMVIGIALRAVDRPAKEASWMLFSPLVLLFFTHPFRFPMAVGALSVVVGLSWAFKRRCRSLLPAVAMASLVGIVWWFARPAELVVDLGEVRVNWGRASMAGFGEHPYRSLRSGLDAAAFHRALTMLGVLGAVLTFVRWRSKRPVSARSRIALGVVLCCVLATALLYFTLPMSMGSWWFIYPRELSASAFMALALFPDLPRKAWHRLGTIVWLAAAVLPLGIVAVDSHRAFAGMTEDFYRVTRHVPHAPKLLHLVFPAGPSPAIQSPFRHLSGYVHAEKGGWSSFSFAWLGHSPLRFRDPTQRGAVVPPRPPPRWEWTPQRFELNVHGQFYDWFLVRSNRSPAGLFSPDPNIELAAHEGTWWLYQRKP